MVQNTHLTQEQYDHFNTSESARHSKKKNFSSITERFLKDELYRNSQFAVGWAEEHCQISGFAHGNKFLITQLRGKSVSENNNTLGVNGQGTEARTNEEKGRLPASGKQGSASAKASGESKSVYT